MTIHLFATGDRARGITVAAASLLATLLLITSPASAQTAAAGQPNTTVLAQGIGMGDKPSIRVRTVQRALDRRGYDLGAPGVDGRFGPLTDRAVRRFQARRGLAVDGIVGTRTRTALRVRDLTPATTPRPSRPAPASRSPRPTQPQPGSTAQPQPGSTAQPQPGSTAQPQPGSTPQPQPGSTAQPQPGSTAQPQPQPGSTSQPAAPPRATAPPAAQPPASAATPRGQANGERDRQTPWLLPMLIGFVTALLITGLAALARRGVRRWAARPRPAADDDRLAPHLDRDTQHLRATLAVAADPATPDRAAPAPVRAAPVPDRTRALREANDTDVPLIDGTRVIGFVRTRPDGGRADSVEQERTIERACARAGWELIDVVRDGEQHTPRKRPELKGALSALAHVARGEARALVTDDVQALTANDRDLDTLRTWLGDPSGTLVVHQLREPGPGRGAHAPAAITLASRRPVDHEHVEHRDVG